MWTLHTTYVWHPMTNDIDLVTIVILTGYICRHGRHGVPSYLLCLSHLNHILLVKFQSGTLALFESRVHHSAWYEIFYSQVINSATNFFLYCWVARRFRVELKIWLRSVIASVGRICSNETTWRSWLWFPLVRPLFPFIIFLQCNAMDHSGFYNLHTKNTTQYCL